MRIADCGLRIGDAFQLSFCPFLQWEKNEWRRSVSAWGMAPNLTAHPFKGSEPSGEFSEEPGVSRMISQEIPSIKKLEPDRKMEIALLLPASKTLLGSSSAKYSKKSPPLLTSLTVPSVPWSGLMTAKVASGVQYRWDCLRLVVVSICHLFSQGLHLVVIGSKDP